MCYQILVGIGSRQTWPPAVVEKNVFCREFVEEFIGMSFIIFGGDLDRFGNF